MKNDFTPIIQKIDSNNDICLLVHENPDGDAIGSLIGLLKALELKEKRVTGFIEKRPVNCEFLLEAIGKSVKTFDEIDFEKKYDLCIVLDCSDLGRLGIANKLFINAKDTACIDHHFNNKSFSNADYIEPTAAATGELIYALLGSMDLPLNMDIATALYASIASDTGNFSHNNTTKKTFKIASELMEYDIDVTKISYHMFSETSLNRTVLLGRVLQKIEMFFNGKLAVLVANKKDINELGVDQSELEGIVDYARYIKGVEVGLFIKPYDEKTYKVSMRSNGNVELLGIASEFMGGGHKFAAGCKIEASTIEEVKKVLVEAFSKIM